MHRTTLATAVSLGKVNTNLHLIISLHAV